MKFYNSKELGKVTIPEPVSVVNSDNYIFDNCPKCGSENELDWMGFDLDGASGHYDVQCGKCGFEGRQWQKMTFDGWQEYNENTGQYDDIPPYLPPPE